MIPVPDKKNIQKSNEVWLGCTVYLCPWCGTLKRDTQQQHSYEKETRPSSSAVNM